MHHSLDVSHRMWGDELIGGDPSTFIKYHITRVFIHDENMVSGPGECILHACVTS